MKKHLEKRKKIKKENEKVANRKLGNLGNLWNIRKVIPNFLVSEFSVLPKNSDLKISEKNFRDLSGFRVFDRAYYFAELKHLAHFWNCKLFSQIILCHYWGFLRTAEKEKLLELLVLKEYMWVFLKWKAHLVVNSVDLNFPNQQLLF